MKHNNKMTYVMSGCSHTRIVLGGISSKEYDELRRVMRILNTSNHEHTFGLLYNAWTERRFGEVFRDKFADSIDCIQADSGGLQIITQGKTITEKMKQDVYLNQGAWSDMAMSFDEIPLSFSGDKSSRLDLGNRWFDKDKFEFCARETGRNVKNQIECFLKNNSKAKPIFITQGNCYETYMRWTELALKEIPQELQAYIGGIAMGAAALGHGMLEDVKRAFYFTQLPLNEPVNHMHLLAVGSVYRLVPNLLFMDSGLYNNLHLTIDSTTHSSGVNMGRVLMMDGALDFPRHFDRAIYQRIYDEMERHFGKLEYDLDHFHYMINQPGSKYRESTGSIDWYVDAYFKMAALSAQNFKNTVDSLSDHADKIIEVAAGRDQLSALCLRHLSTVKDKTDFDYWEKTFARHLASNPVQSGQPNNLEEFFG